MSNVLPYRQLSLQMNHISRIDLWCGWSAAEDNRQWSELWLVIGGSAYLHVDGHQYRLKAGDICLLPDILPKANGCDTDDGFDVLVFHFDATLLSASLFEHIRCDTWVVHPEPAVFDELYQLAVSNHLGYYYTTPPTLQQVLKMDFALHAALNVFFKLAKVTELKINDWLGDTLRYIAENCEQKLSIDLLAHRVAMHPKHFARCFRERTGLPPGKYIADVRLKRAIQMLYEGASLQDISECIGFQSVQQFFRFFKQQTGMTPRAYQKNHIKGEQ